MLRVSGLNIVTRRFADLMLDNEKMDEYSLFVALADLLSSVALLSRALLLSMCLLLAIWTKEMPLLSNVPVN